MSHFNALTGHELKAAILAKITAALDKSEEFTNNVTFPLAFISFQVSVWTYPKQNFTPAGKPLETEEPEIKISDLFPESEKLSTQAVETSLVSHEETISVPDKTRIESGLAVPVMAPGPDGILRDEMKYFSPTSAQAPTPETSQTSQTSQAPAPSTASAPASSPKPIQPPKGAAIPVKPNGPRNR
jgi:hypothetical protein